MYKTYTKYVSLFLCICFLVVTIFPIESSFAAEKTSLQQAQEKLKEAEKKVEEAENRVNNALSNAANANFNAYAASAKVYAAKAFQNPTEVANAQKEAATAQSNAEKAQGDLTTAKNDLETAKTDLKKAKENLETEEKKAEGCDMTDFGCKINKWLYETAAAGLQFFLNILVKTLLNQDDLSKNPTVVKYQTLFGNLSWTFLLLFLIYQLVRVLSLLAMQEDYSELKPLIRNVVIAACLIQSLNWICENLFYLNKIFVDGNIDSINVMPSRFDGLLAISNSVPLMVFLVILFVLSIVISIQIAIRTVEIAFFMVIGPIAIATIVNRELNFFSRWWRNMVALIFTQSMQVLLIVMGVEWIWKNTTQIGTVDTPLMVGLFVLIMRMPNLVNEWFQSSSAAQSANGMALQAVRSVYGGVSKMRVARRQQQQHQDLIGFISSQKK